MANYIPFFGLYFHEALTEWRILNSPSLPTFVTLVYDLRYMLLRIKNLNYEKNYDVLVLKCLYRGASATSNF